MAIQQAVTCELFLVGDGVATTFTYSFAYLFNLAIDTGAIINSQNLPSAVNITNVAGAIPTGGNAALDSLGNLTLTFPSAWSGQGTVFLTLLFNSATALGASTVGWTSATALNTAVTISTLGNASVTLAITISGTVTAGTVVFEVSTDNVNWFAVTGTNPGVYVTTSTWTSTTGGITYQFNVSAYRFFRSRLSGVITGSGTINIIEQASTLPAVPAVAVSGIASVAQSSTPWITQDKKDIGRTYLSFVVDTGLINAEALQSMSINKAGTVSTATSYTVTAGKTLRLQALSIGIVSTGPIQSVRGRVRAVPSGSVLITSPQVADLAAGNPVLVSGAGTFSHIQGNSSISTGAGIVTNSVTLGAAPRLGDLVCVAVITDSGNNTSQTAMTVKDSNNNSYTVTPGSPSTALTGGGQVWLAYLLSAPANATAVINAAWTGATTSTEMWADEFSPNSGIIAFDKDAKVTNNTPGTTINTPSITPATAGELLFACAASSGIITAPTANGTLGAWTGSGGGVQNGDMAEYDLAASVAQAVNFTQNSSSWAAMAMAFSITAVGSAGSEVLTFPDGFELPTGSQLGITQVASGTSGNFVCTLVGFEY